MIQTVSHDSVTDESGEGFSGRGVLECFQNKSITSTIKQCVKLLLYSNSLCPNLLSSDWAFDKGSVRRAHTSLILSNGVLFLFSALHLTYGPPFFYYYSLIKELVVLFSLDIPEFCKYSPHGNTMAVVLGVGILSSFYQRLQRWIDFLKRFLPKKWGQRSL